MKDKIRRSLLALDPRTKILILVGFLLVGVAVLDPFLTLVIMLFILVLYWAAGIPAREVWNLSKPLLVACVMFFLLNFPFTQPKPGETIFFYLFPPDHVPITMTGILTGIGNALRFVMFIWVANFITSITPTSDILLALNKSRIPPEICIAISIAFSYIPELQREFFTIIEAQKSRAAKFEHRNPFRKLYAYIPVIVPALFISILRGRDIARAIEARGFTYNPAGRTYRREIHLRGEDYVVMAVTAAVTVTVLYLKYRYGMFNCDFIYQLLRG